VAVPETVIAAVKAAQAATIERPLILPPKVVFGVV
jgi:hypothetical protein